MSNKTTTYAPLLRIGDVIRERHSMKIRPKEWEIIGCDGHFYEWRIFVGNDGIHLDGWQYGDSNVADVDRHVREHDFIVIRTNGFKKLCRNSK